MLRSTRFTIQLVLGVLALGAGATIGCSNDAATASEYNSPTTPLDDQGASGGPTKPGADAAPAKAAPYRGNPLCHVEKDTCMPDDDGYQRSLTSAECATPPPGITDGGPPAESSSKGCRIKHDNVTMTAAPYCFEKATPAGVDGATCEIGEDCAPGLDCVSNEKGTKTCRHYCCSGSCKGNMAANGGATFCDVQSLVDAPQKAPVCMPLKRCTKLLGSGECAANETCTVVTEAGDTGCVVVGDKQVGQSCDDSHCAAKLTCLGQPGARNCFKLCKVTAADCPSGQTCVTSAAFQNGDFGICQ